MGGWCRETVGLENKTKIFISCTTADSVRGKSLDCIDGESKITVKNKVTKKIEEITIDELKKRLNKNNMLEEKCVKDLIPNKDLIFSISRIRNCKINYNY